MIDPSPPLPSGEQERLDALDKYPLLDTDPQAAYDDIVRLAAFICGTPIAAVTLVDAQRQWFKSVLGLPVRETPRDVAFCAHTILQPDLLIVPDAQADPRFADNPLVTGDPHIRFYAGAPLVAEGGHALGALCVIDRVPRSLTMEQQDALRTLARQIVGQMEMARWAAAQDRLIEERKRAEQEKDKLLGEARERADRDPLTGLLNHRAFYNRLDVEAARARREHTTLAVVVLDLDNFKFFNDAYGHTTGDEVLRLVAGKLQAVCHTQARFGGDEFALLLPSVGPTTTGEIETRLHAALHGLFYSVSEREATIPVLLSLGTALFPEAGTDCHEVLRLAGERLRWSKTGGDLDENAQPVRADAGSRFEGFSMLDALVTAVDNKDRYTRRHSADVMEYSLIIAHTLGLDGAEQRTVAVSALLHDVGKIGVPDSILRKPGRLTDQEFAVVKQHPTMGAIMVQAVSGLEGTLDAVRHHHERWDGGGYPSGLAGKQIPRTARLMAVADAFSAMTMDRPYRSGMGREQALSILAAGSGTQWDPDCVGVFLPAMGKIQAAGGHTRSATHWGRV